jgi:hypothetical protein
MQTELDYKCPKCHQKMEEGYLVSNHWIVWTEREDFANTSIWGEEKLTKIGWIKNPNIPGIRCRKCNLAIWKFEDIKKSGGKIHFMNKVVI